VIFVELILEMVLCVFLKLEEVRLVVLVLLKLERLLTYNCPELIYDELNEVVIAIPERYKFAEVIFEVIKLLVYILLTVTPLPIRFDKVIFEALILFEVKLVLIIDVPMRFSVVIFVFVMFVLIRFEFVIFVIREFDDVKVVVIKFVAVTFPSRDEEFTTRLFEVIDCVNKLLELI